MENLPVKRGKVVKWLGIWGVWTLFGLFFTTQLALQSQLWKTPVPFWTILSWQLVSGYVWFALSPLILFLTNKFPFEDQKWRVSLPVHIVAAVIVALFQQAIDAFLLTRLGYPPGREFASFGEASNISFSLICTSVSLSTLLS